MREILFRGKREDGRWGVGYLADEYSKVMIINDAKHDEWFRVKKDTIGQYTGLHDSDGNEIFEGDILYDDYENAVVVFWDGCFVAQMRGLVLNLFEFDGVVVGNVHDNPELVPWCEVEAD